MPGAIPRDADTEATVWRNADWVPLQRGEAGRADQAGGGAAGGAVWRGNGGTGSGRSDRARRSAPLHLFTSYLVSARRRLRGRPPQVPAWVSGEVYPPNGSLPCEASGLAGDDR